MATSQTSQGYPIAVFELIDRQKSGFILEGTERTGNPIHLDGPSWQYILPHSRIQQPDGTYRAIRYVANADTIFVDEQKERGIEFNAKRDRILFEGVQKTVTRRGNTIGLYDFLTQCEYCQQAPNRPTDDNGTPMEANVRFKEIRPVEIARKDVSFLKFDLQAQKILSEIYAEKDGKFEYDTNRLRMIATILGVDKTQSDDEVMQDVAIYAKTNAEHFCTTIANKQVEVQAEIKDAIAFGVLVFEGNKAILRSTNAVIHIFKKKAIEEQHEELARMFLYPEFAPVRQMVRIDNDAVRMKQATLE